MKATAVLLQAGARMGTDPDLDPGDDLDKSSRARMQGSCSRQGGKQGAPPSVPCQDPRSRVMVGSVVPGFEGSPLQEAGTRSRSRSRLLSPPAERLRASRPCPPVPRLIPLPSPIVICTIPDQDHDHDSRGQDQDRDRDLDRGDTGEEGGGVGSVRRAGRGSDAPCPTSPARAKDPEGCPLWRIRGTRRASTPAEPVEVLPPRASVNVIKIALS